MTGICPCCGNALQIDRGAHFALESLALVSSDYAVVFTKHEAALFDVLWRNRNTGRVSTKGSLFDHLYSDDPSGGPDIKVIEVLICRIRKKLEVTNIEIATVFDTGYFLRNRAASSKKSRRQPQESVA